MLAPLTFNSHVFTVKTKHAKSTVGFLKHAMPFRRKSVSTTALKRTVNKPLNKGFIK
jgi:hypothetical protein